MAVKHPVRVEGNRINAVVYVRVIPDWLSILVVSGPEMHPSIVDPVYVIANAGNSLSRTWESFGGTDIGLIRQVRGRDRNSMREVILEFLRSEGVPDELITINLSE